MKTIQKNSPHESLIKASKECADWSEFVESRHAEYLKVRAQGIAEQQNECAYTGMWIGEGTKENLHLDHFRKRAIYPKLTFEWDNIYAAVKSNSYGADFKDGKVNGENAEEIYKSILSPNVNGLQRYFWFQTDGKMIPSPELSEAERKMAKATIVIFNLNHKSLKDKRYGVMATIRSLSQLDEKTIRECIASAGFSFVTEFELAQG